MCVWGGVSGGCHGVSALPSTQTCSPLPVSQLLWPNRARRPLTYPMMPQNSAFHVQNGSQALFPLPVLPAGRNSAQTSFPSSKNPFSRGSAMRQCLLWCWVSPLPLQTAALGLLPWFW